MTKKRPSVYELEKLARERYPDESRQWHWRYAKMASRIIGWERKYSGFQKFHEIDIVRLFVNEEYTTTRSPAKKQALIDWEVEQAESNGT